MCLPPRSGQLFAAAPETVLADGPPLSEVKTIRLFSHIPFALSASVTLPTAESTAEIMPL